MKKFNIFDIKCFLLFFFTISINKLSGQTITVNLSDYSTFCSGNTLSVPVTLDGNWNSDNKFKLKLTEESLTGDTTIIIEASNNISPLLFQIPAIYASAIKRNNYYFKLSIESTSPAVVSNQLNAVMGLLPTIQMGYPIQPSDNKNSIINEYANPETFKTIIFDLFDGDNRNYTSYVINDSLSYSYPSILSVKPISTKSYSFTKVRNFCGDGQILPPNLAKVKVNSFKIKITNISPTIVCEDRKFQITIDYTGNFASNNQFIIEIANIVGDSIRQVPITILDNKNFIGTLDDSFLKGKYLVRLRGTSPDVATAYVPLVIAGKPQVNLGWGINAENPIGYKNEVWLSITVDHNEGVQPLAIKLSDGQIIKFNQSSTDSFLAILRFNPEKSMYYKVDSLITSCGVSQNFSVTGERDLVVKKDFYIEDLHKKDFCAGEKIRFKIKSDYVFENNNIFTAKLSINDIHTINSEVNQVGDSLEFIIPPTPAFENTFWDLDFKIEASSPMITSTTYWERLDIHAKPEIDVSNSSKNVLLPGKISIQAIIRSEAPVFLTVSDGLRDFKTQVYGTNSNHFSYGYFWLTPVQTTTYQVKSIENACGVTSYNPSLPLTVNVNNSTQRSIHLVKNPPNICMGNSYQVEFLTSGTFLPNNEFIVKLTYQSETYEVGRGTSSPITITIPANIPLVSGANYCQFTITSTQTETENLPLENRQNSASILWNQIANFEYSIIHPSEINVTQKEINILNGESIRTIVKSPNTNITDKYNIKVNDKWFNHTDFFDPNSYYNSLLLKIKPKKDTILYINKIENACGQFSLNDTLKIRVGNYRIRYAIIDGGRKCKGNYMDVMIAVEGLEENRPNSFKIYIVPYDIKLKRFEAPIIQILNSNTYRIQIPDMPYDGMMTLDIVSTQNANLFVEDYNKPYFYINKIPHVKLTSLNGSSIAWMDGTSTEVKLKVETINSENLFWNGKIVGLNTSNGLSFSVYSKTSTPWMKASDGNIFELSGIENECGYGISSGTVVIKYCHNNLNLNGYNYNTTGEYYSNSFIRSNILNTSPASIKLYSAKDSIELLPGFKTNAGQNFKAEIQGCEVDR